MMIQHDMGHCDKEVCLVKEECVRYRLHLEAVDKKMQWVCYIYCEDGSFFVPVKKEEK
jgi:hypothetical protein